MNQPDDTMSEIEITYVEMLDPDQLLPSPKKELVVTEAEIPSPELNRFLYTAVGSRWSWTHRNDWSYEKWQQYLSLPSTHTWVGYVRGTPAGYFELDHEGAEVEIRSFGLLPQFYGRGLGGDLLTRAVRIAWSMDATRVWLHTCSLDSPLGLKNYLARGFRIYKTERSRECQKMAPPEPW